jgi:hypothetical protein
VLGGHDLLSDVEIVMDTIMSPHFSKAQDDFRLNL